VKNVYLFGEELKNIVKDQLMITTHEEFLKTNFNGVVPTYIKITIAYIKENGIYERELFSNLNEDLITLRDEVIDKMNQKSFTVHDFKNNVYVASDILKTFLKRLPTQIMTLKYFFPFINISNLEEDIIIKVEFIKSIINSKSFPILNKNLLKSLFSLLNVVYMKSEINFMNLEYLSTNLSNSFFHQNFHYDENLKAICNVLNIFIEYFEIIFE
jgi:hypothetical protein